MVKKTVALLLVLFALSALMGGAATAYADGQYTLTVRYLDEEGNALALEDEIQTTGKYSVKIKQITGYTYDFSDLPVSGVIRKDTVLTMTYKEMVFYVTVNFFDLDGKKIKEPKKYPVTLHTYLVIDLRKDGVIDGYTFTGDNETIPVGVVGDVTMNLVYRKNGADDGGTGGCGSVAEATAGAAASCFTMLACVVVALRKKKIR